MTIKILIYCKMLNLSTLLLTCIFFHFATQFARTTDTFDRDNLFIASYVNTALSNHIDYDRSKDEKAKDTRQYFHDRPGFVTFGINPYIPMPQNKWKIERRLPKQTPFTRDQLQLRVTRDDYYFEKLNNPAFGVIEKRLYTNVGQQYFRKKGKKTEVSRYQMRKFPYTNIVRLSSGCTGTLLTPYHVITAAHCVHNGAGFKNNLEMLKVYVPDKLGYRVHYIVKITVPVMWMKAQLIPEYAYDYAVIQLNLPVIGREKFMQLALPTTKTKYSDLHFFGFFPERVNGLWESTCSSDENRFIYGGNVALTECESAVGNSGAAVFAEDVVHDEKIIGILSNSLTLPRDKSYEAIMLLTLPKLLDICAMIYPEGEKYDVCVEVKRHENEYLRVGANRIMPFFG